MKVLILRLKTKVKLTPLRAWILTWDTTFLLYAEGPNAFFVLSKQLGLSSRFLLKRLIYLSVLKRIFLTWIPHFVPRVLFKRSTRALPEFLRSRQIQHLLKLTFEQEFKFMFQRKLNPINTRLGYSLFSFSFSIFSFLWYILRCKNKDLHENPIPWAQIKFFCSIAVSLQLYVHLELLSKQTLSWDYCSL